MHFTTSLLPLLIMGLTRVVDGLALMPGISIKFYKFEHPMCSGQETVHHLHSRNCKNMDHPIRSFFYEREDGWLHRMFGWRQDFEDPRCTVIVFEQPDCVGGGFSWGSMKLFPTSTNCHEIDQERGGQAWSVKVTCEHAAIEGDLQNGMPLNNTAGWRVNVIDGEEHWTAIRNITSKPAPPPTAPTAPAQIQNNIYNSPAPLPPLRDYEAPVNEQPGLPDHYKHVPVPAGSAEDIPPADYYGPLPDQPLHNYAADVNRLHPPRPDAMPPRYYRNPQARPYVEPFPDNSEPEYWSSKPQE